MKVFWLILTLIPVAFLFHFYEYGQHVKREEPSYLFLGCFLFVVIVGFLSGNVKIGLFFGVNVISVLFSILLAIYFIPDDGSWFKPVGRSGAVIFVAVVMLIGQLIVRELSRVFIVRKEV